MLPTVTLLGRVLPTYGLFAALGAVLGLGISLLRCHMFGRSRDDCAYLFAFGAIGAIIGAKALYLLTVLPELLADLPLLWEDTSLFAARYISGGMVFYGGFLGGILGAWGAARYFHLRLTGFFPVLIPALPLVHAMGRVGCFCAGCCYGVEAPAPLGIAFTQSAAAPNGVPLFPVQLWECGAELAIFCFLLWYTARPVSGPRILTAYVLCYAPVRFVLEFLRGDATRGLLGPMSLSQWISLAALAAALSWLLFEKGRHRESCPP